MLRRCFWLLLVLLGTGCDRPFVEMQPPDILVAGPDLSVIQTESQIRLQLEAASPRSVIAVSVDGTSFARNPETGFWEGTVTLSRGLNTLQILSEDEDGTTGTTTAYALHYTFRTPSFAPFLPSPRGGHTATRLLDGSLLITGGANEQDVLAFNEALLLGPGSSEFSHLLGDLITPRAGHTATLLPDGDVIIVGGGTSDVISSVDELLETVERYDAETRTFVPMGFRGQPIRRMHHTALLRVENNRVLLDLYGGRGDIRYGDTPRLGIREDLRTFEITADSVIALNSLASASRLLSVSGHIQAPLALAAPGDLNRYLVSGTSYGAQSTDSISFILDYTTERITFDDDLPPLLQTRSRHAAVTLAPGLVALLGGRQEEVPPAEINSVELYVDAARQYFLFPSPSGIQRRFGHTATFFPPNRILLLGGFFGSGDATLYGEYLEIDL